VRRRPPRSLLAFLKKAFRLLVVDTTPSSFSLEAFSSLRFGPLLSRVDDGFLLFGGLFLPFFFLLFLRVTREDSSREEEEEEEEEEV